MIDLDVARKEELPETFTSQDIEDIKAEIDIPRANVNIVPYHIYDEDEHTVGEWRETIGGVKKKKPVYEKTFFNVTKETVVLTNVEVVVDAIIRYKGNDQNPNIRGIGDGFTQQASNYFVLNNGNLYSSSWTSQVGELNKTLLSTTIQYTKTTDEWEVV